MNFSFPKFAILPTAIFALTTPHLAHAQSATPLSALYACEALSTDAAQLECYRAETAKLRAGEGVALPQTPAMAPATPSAPAAETAAPKAPEFAPLAQDKAKAPKTRTMAITATATNSKGYVRFTLENGEIWQQIEKARVRLGDGTPDKLTIKRKAFGSFLGNVNGKRPSFRVRRVQ